MSAGVRPSLPSRARRAAGRPWRRRARSIVRLHSTKALARYFWLAARYAENPRALRVKLRGGTPETFCRLDRPWFHELKLGGVIDVGANEGQFATTMRALLPEADIHAFEPIPECCERARARFAGDAHFHLHNLALGDRKTRARFGVTADTGGSSLLPPSEVSRRHFPEAQVVREIDVPVERLDDVIDGVEVPKPYLLKADVQGYEYEVLIGGRRTLAQARVVVLEASFERFYEGQALFEDILALVRENGFLVVDLFNVMHDPATGRALQGDFLFVRSNGPAAMK